MNATTVETTEVTDESTAPIEYEKGSWQDSLQKASNLFTRSVKAKGTASKMLWKGAKEGIEGWLPNSATDVSGEGLYGDVIEALGTSRKGDASKIKTVAIAVRTHSLDLSAYDNLSKAYGAARALTVLADQHIVEDDAAEEAVSKIEAPKTTGSVEGAALILLSKGIDGAVVAILDGLGANNEAAHKSFMRAVAAEVADRIKANKPKPAPKAPAAPKAGATAAKKAGAKKATPIKTAATKGKPAAKGKPVRAAEPVEPTIEEPVDETDDLDVDETVEAVETPAVPVAKKAKARPVRRQR